MPAVDPGSDWGVARRWGGELEQPGTLAAGVRDCPVGPRTTLVFHLAIAAATLFPLLTVALPPLADLPNHLARFHIMNALAGDSNLQRHYRIAWELLSFQSSDLIVPLLAKLFGLEAAARLAVVATFATLFGGVICLHKALYGRVGLWPATAALLFYNFMLAWGLLSFLFTAGLALMLFAGWIASIAREGLLRSAGFTLGALIVFLFHPLAFAVFALLTMAFELWRWLKERPLDWRQFARRALLNGWVVVPGLLILFAPKSGVPTFNFYGTIDDKIRAVLSPVTMYIEWTDFALGFALIGLFWIGRRLNLFVFRAIDPLAGRGRRDRRDPDAERSDERLGLRFRLPTLIVLLLIGGTELILNTRRHAFTLVGFLLCLALLRSAFIAADWRQMAAGHRRVPRRDHGPRAWQQSRRGAVARGASRQAGGHSLPPIVTSPTMR